MPFIIILNRLDCLDKIVAGLIKTGEFELAEGIMNHTLYQGPDGDCHNAQKYISREMEIPSCPD